MVQGVEDLPLAKIILNIFYINYYRICIRNVEKGINSNLRVCCWEADVSSQVHRVFAIYFVLKIKLPQEISCMRHSPTKIVF